MLRDLHKVVDGCTEEVVEDVRREPRLREGQLRPRVRQRGGGAGLDRLLLLDSCSRRPPKQRDGLLRRVRRQHLEYPATVTAAFGSDPLDISKSVYRAVPKGGGLDRLRAHRGADLTRARSASSSSRKAKRRRTRSTMFVSAEVNGRLPRRRHEGARTSLQGVPSLDRRARLRLRDLPVRRRQELHPVGDAPHSVDVLEHELHARRRWRYQHRFGLGYPFVQIVAQEEPKFGSAPRRRHRRHRRDRRPGGSVAELEPEARRSRCSADAGREPRRSALEASHPVALFGGNQCAYVPESDGACDSLTSRSRRSASGRPPTRPSPTRRAARRSKARRSRARTCPGRSSPRTKAPPHVHPVPPLNARPTLDGGQRAFFSTEQLFTVKTRTPTTRSTSPSTCPAPNSTRPSAIRTSSTYPERSVPRSLRVLRRLHVRR